MTGNLSSSPRIVARKCGGWLAVSPPNSALRIGVTANTQDEAASKFTAAEAEWSLLLGNDAETINSHVVS